MDVTAIVLTLLFGAMAVVFANMPLFASDAVRRERYVRNGVLRGAGTPDADASEAFIAREKHRERLALVGSVLITLVAVSALALTGPPTVQTIGFVVLCAAFLGRGVVIAILSAREATTQVTRGPRVSRGDVRGLADWVPVAPWLAAALAQGAFLAAYVPQSLALRPDLAGWVLALAAISVLATLGGWALALWLARRPQLASDAAELAWSDATRRRDLTATLLTGPFLAVGATVSAFTYGGDGPMGDAVGTLPVLAFAYLAVAAALAAVGGVMTSRRDREREVAHA